MFVPQIIEKTTNGNLVVFFGNYFLQNKSLHGPRWPSFFGYKSVSDVVKSVETIGLTDINDIIFRPTYRVVSLNEFNEIRKDFFITSGGIEISEAIQQHTFPDSPSTPIPGEEDAK